MVGRIAAAVCSICLLGSAGPATQVPAPPHRIRIASFRFVPAADTVRVGQSVTFRNEDLVPHTATADDSTRKFESGTIAANGTWRFTARRKGVVSYHCRFHPTMRGTIVVR
jgi:plastocyanin